MSSLLPDADEHLATGWEPALDPADSLVRQAVDAHASWAVHVARSAGRPWADQPGWVASHCRDEAAMANLALVRVPPPDLAQVAAEILAWYPVGIPHLLVSPFPAPGAVLAGYSLIGHPPLMVRPATVESADAPLSAPEDRLEVRRIHTADQLVDAERVLVEGYPMPELQPFQPGSVYDAAFLDDQTAVFVAYDGDEPLGTAVAHSAAGMTLVENVAALGAARGRGVGAAVTAAATEAFGHQPAVLIASDDGQPVYQRLGYLRIERWTAWLRTPPLR